jgi:hypothetical protein
MFALLPKEEKERKNEAHIFPSKTALRNVLRAVHKPKTYSLDLPALVLSARASSWAAPFL